MAKNIRGLCFAPVGEVGTPVALPGAAIGQVSTPAFLSDIFNFTLIGSILDNKPGPPGIIGIAATAGSRKKDEHSGETEIHHRDRRRNAELESLNLRP